MKVLHIINNLGGGGAEKTLVDTLLIYQKLGVNVSILLLTNKNSRQEYITKLREANIIVDSLSQGSTYNPLLLIKCYFFLKKNNADILHVHLFPSLYFVSLISHFRTKRNMIYTEHSSRNKRLGKFYFKMIESFIYSPYDKIVAVSPEVRQIVVNWVVPAKKVIVIRNGINLKSKQSSYSKNYLAQQLKIPARGKLLLMVARLNYPKDQATVIKALALLPDYYYLLLAGTGEQLTALKQQVISLGLDDRVKFLGFRNDVVRLMKSVDMNVLSTRYEGMSGATLQAIASKKPFLGSDVTGINDLVPDKRFLFKPGNEVELAKRIQDMLSNRSLRNDMIEDGYRYIHQYSLENMCDKHVKLYKSLMNKI